MTYSTKLLSTILIFCLFILGTISIALEINNQFLVLMNIYIQLQATKWSSWRSKVIRHLHVHVLNVQNIHFRQVKNTPCVHAKMIDYMSLISKKIEIHIRNMCLEEIEKSITGSKRTVNAVKDYISYIITCIYSVNLWYINYVIFYTFVIYPTLYFAHLTNIIFTDDTGQFSPSWHIRLEWPFKEVIMHSLS